MSFGKALVALCAIGSCAIAMLLYPMASGSALRSDFTDYLETMPPEAVDAAHRTLPDFFDVEGSSSAAPSVTFLGTSTLLFFDPQSKSAFMTDGFFTRDSGDARGPIGIAGLALNPFASTVAPKQDRIDQVFQKLGMKPSMLQGIATVHSHHDHAQDSGTICAMAGPHCKIIGSNSTANVVRGAVPGFDERQLEIVPADATRHGPVHLGVWDVTLVRSKHVWLPLVGHLILNANVESPLKTPSHLLAFKEGGSFVIIVKHRPSGASWAVVGSANWVDGALQNDHVDTVFLGVGALGRETPEYRSEYWRQTAGFMKPKLVVPIHWDDFTIPLTENERTMEPSSAMDTMVRWLRDSGAKQKVDVAWMPIWSTFRAK